jgi:GNAT superfamily N-acetyltransferase
VSEFVIRHAGIADVGIIASHRARMFRDMGQVSPEMFEPLRAGAERWLTEGFRRGEYVGWLASAASSPDAIIAGAGIQLRRVAPHPNGAGGVAEGRHAIVINVFTEPEWRRRGLGEALMREILEWAKAERLDRLLLHASKEGHRLYEKLGFAATNEMRLSPQS